MKFLVYSFFSEGRHYENVKNKTLESRKSKEDSPVCLFWTVDHKTTEMLAVHLALAVEMLDTFFKVEFQSLDSVSMDPGNCK